MDRVGQDVERVIEHAVEHAVVAGRYRIAEAIGSGAASRVFRAVDLELDVPVALKVLRGPEDDGAAGRRFQEEIRLLASFDHPNLVPVLDAGTDGGRPFFVMPLIEGPTMEGLLGGKPVIPDVVRRVGSGVAEALGYIHARGVVHRDIKPDNVLLDGCGGVFLADFGVAEAWDGPAPAAEGCALGTAGYLAPELAEGGGASAASDVYALGLVLLEALTGHREYCGTPLERAVASATRSPHVPAALGAPWCRILRRMTARDPGARPRIEEVRRILGSDSEASLSAVHPEAVAEPSAARLRLAGP